MDAPVKHGPAKSHTGMNIHLGINQIKALVITVIAETLMARKRYGAIPLILKSAGKSAKRLMLQVRNRKKNKRKNRKRNKKANTSPEKEKTTEVNRV